MGPVVGPVGGAVVGVDMEYIGNYDSKSNYRLRSNMWCGVSVQLWSIMEEQIMPQMVDTLWFDLHGMFNAANYPQLNNLAWGLLWSL